MYRFRSVDVSDKGPFDSVQSVSFADGLTIIAAGNGLGKTTLVKALRREFSESDHTATMLDGMKIPDWLVFFDDKIRLPLGGEPWNPIASCMSRSPAFTDKRNEFEIYVAKAVPKLLGDKMGLMGSAKQLFVNINPNGAVKIMDSQNHFDIAVDWQSMGERVVLYLALNYAVRKLFSLDLPFVVDSMLGMLDWPLKTSCFEFIGGMSGQVIVLDEYSNLQDVRSKADFQIIPHPVSGKSIIARRI